MSDFITTPGGILIPAPKTEPEPPQADQHTAAQNVQYVVKMGYGLDPTSHGEMIERLGAKPPEKKSSGPFDPECLFIPPTCPTCKRPAIGHYGIETTCMGGAQCPDCKTGHRDVNRISAVWVCENDHTFAAKTGYFCDSCGKASHWWADESSKGTPREVNRPKNFMPFLNPPAAWRVSKFFTDNKICGCGQPKEFIEWLTKLLRAISDSFDDKADNGKTLTKEEYENQPKQLLTKAANHEGLYWQAWYWLDATGLIEHGGVVCNGWLTDKGEELLAALELLGVDGAYEAIK